MTKRRILFYGLMLLSAGMLLYSGDGIYLWIILFQLFILLLGAVNIALTMACVTFVQTIEPEIVARDEVATLHIEIHNEYILPFAHLVLHYGTAESAFDYADRRYFASVFPYSCEKAELKLYCPYRGEYDVGLLELEAVDLFGLLKFRRKVEKFRSAEKLKLLVYPRLKELPPGTLFNRNDEGANISSNSRAEEISSIAEIRDFRQGDPLKKVHWKLSARTGKLVVKEFEGTVTPESVIMLDCTDHGLTGELAARIEDMITESATAFCKRFCDDFRRLRLVAYTGERNVIESSSPDDFLAMYTFLAKVHFNGDLPIDAALKLESDSPDGLSSLVLITKEPSDQLFEAICSLSASDCDITLVLALTDDETSERLARMLGEFNLRGIRVITLTPGEDISARMGA